jgi:protein gp37
MNEDQIDELAGDIQRNGQIEPIVLTADGCILVDGRNRYKACKKARVEPHYHHLSADMEEAGIIDYIVSKNMERRNLNPGQRALLAVQLVRDELYALGLDHCRQVGMPETEENIRSFADALDMLPSATPLISRARHGLEFDRYVAARFHIGNTTVSQAVKVLEPENAEFAQEVITGEATLNEAYENIRARERRDSDESSGRSGGGRRGTRSGTTSNVLTLKTHTGVEVRYVKPKGKSKFNETTDAVSWAYWTWNPVTGCLHGCKYCYARAIAHQRSMKKSYPVGFTPLFHSERLDAPHNHKVPDEARDDPRKRRVFVCSMADLYGKWVPDEWIEQVHQACIDNPQWEYLMLTKFPRRYVGLQLPRTAWLGTSVDEQKRVRFAEEAFRQISNVRVKWLSLEPLLAPLKFNDLSMFDWVVIGSQTATIQPDGVEDEYAPPFEWVARLVAQAREAGCKIYLKPNLLGVPDPQNPGMRLIQENPLGER